MTRTRSTFVAGLLVVVAAGGLATALPATASAAPTLAVADAAQQATAPLREFRTSDNSGTFYTLNAAEADRAGSQFGFRPTDEARGITLYAAAAPGRVEAHRLRLKTGKVSYLVSTSPTEIRSLTTGDKAAFVDEGVLGYVDARAGAGQMVLHRYSKNSEWRVARADRADLLKAGFADDGPLGAVPRG
ncbi:hypothetical protein ACQEVB_04640 [Pseudonocardia sp. CA-107938]|uniref:hypothetical protein n=1 Tax=Pseudonocardia sp. CA-107938 TaxID=3240021 RepID=UPI003D8C0672